MAKNLTPEVDKEIVAISAVYEALKGLDADSQNRAMTYVAAKLGIQSPARVDDSSQTDRHSDAQRDSHGKEDGTDRTVADDEFEGISPVAKKWMTRNGLRPQELSALFSLGADEIDLIAKTVPGSSKREKMRSVFLLKGIAAYLGSGAARFTHEEMKEAALHYDAFDATNFAHHLKGLASEVSGSKGTGYSLTTRGLSSATDIVKSAVNPA